MTFLKQTMRNTLCEFPIVIAMLFKYSCMYSIFTTRVNNRKYDFRTFYSYQLYNLYYNHSLIRRWLTALVSFSHRRINKMIISASFTICKYFPQNCLVNQMARLAPNNSLSGLPLIGEFLYLLQLNEAEMVIKFLY